MQLSDGRDQTRPDQRRLDNPVLLSCPVFSQHGPFSRHVILQNHLSPAAVCHMSSSPLSSRWPFPVSSSTHHLPRVPSPPRQPPTKMCPSHLLSCLLRLSPFSMCFPYNPSRSLDASYSTPRCFGPITPFPCPIFRTGLHAYSLSQSVIPGGSAGGPPYPKVLSWPDHPQSQGSSY
jgi:hypothetical protein